MSSKFSANGQQANGIRTGSTVKWSSEVHMVYSNNCIHPLLWRPIFQRWARWLRLYGRWFCSVWASIWQAIELNMNCRKPFIESSIWQWLGCFFSRSYLIIRIGFSPDTGNWQSTVSSLHWNEWENDCASRERKWAKSEIKLRQRAMLSRIFHIQIWWASCLAGYLCRPPLGSHIVWAHEKNIPFNIHSTYLSVSRPLANINLSMYVYMWALQALPPQSRFMRDFVFVSRVIFCVWHMMRLSGVMCVYLCAIDICLYAEHVRPRQLQSECGLLVCVRAFMVTRYRAYVRLTQ